ncbi:MAG: hypothetical protein IJ466_05955 [Clostridia bacterium]|nr:hypothetical protein [Clostridia bacterium]
MSVFDDFEIILDYAHFWNWAPDWAVVKDIYSRIPESYSVLTPFAFTYLEEMIRSTTPEYGMPFFDRERKPNNFKRGRKLINLAIAENADNKEYVELLNKVKKYFMYESNDLQSENGRNNVLHGHLHPRFWSKESFEQLIHDIAELSPFAGF